MLSARLFLGHGMECRFPLGDGLLRAVGPGLDVHAGQPLGVRIEQARFYPNH